METSRLKAAFATAFCESAHSGIILALYFVVLVAALQLAYLLPQPWSVAAIIALMVVAGSAFSGRWPGRKSRLETLGLGYQLYHSSISLPTAADPLSGARQRSLARLESAIPQSLPISTVP